MTQEMYESKTTSEPILFAFSWIEMQELYSYKEQIARFYEIRGFKRAEIAFNALIKRLEESTIKEI